MAGNNTGGSTQGLIPLPPGMDARWLAREGVNILLNGGVQNAEQLFKKFQCSSPVLSAGASLVDFLTASMTFEDEKMSQAVESLKRTEKLCNVDSLFEGVLTKKPTDKMSFEDRIERMIIWADCELFLAFLMSLRQSMVDFVKAGYYMRRAWKMYERCYNEIREVTHHKNGIGSPGKAVSPKKQNVSSEAACALEASLSFGYGLIQLAISIVPTGLLKVCELLGFQADRNAGLTALQRCSSSDDMKAPIARLTLLWYHTVVRPFCALDGNNIELGLVEASHILDDSKEQYPNSGIFLYFRALILRLRGQLDDALVLLDDVMVRSKDQREIALLCHYDQGWCRMMRMEWDLAAPSFEKLKQDSRWSEAYYTYLLAVNMGASGSLDDAYRHLRHVPKLIKRKTQLENYLTRKANIFKQKSPAHCEYTMLALELLYLWNALPQCSKESLQAMLSGLEQCTTPGMQPMKFLIMGAVHAVLKNEEIALQYFKVAVRKPEGKPMDPHVVPFASYEIAMIDLARQETYERGRDLMLKIRDNYSGYDFENRLNFRIHAAFIT